MRGAIVGGKESIVASERRIARMKTGQQTSRRTWLGPAIALGIWAFWVVLPGALLNGSHPQDSAAAQLGRASVAYLEGAPEGLCWYVILGQLVVLPTLVALVWSRPGPSGHTESGAQARQWSAPLRRLWRAGSSGDDVPPRASSRLAPVGSSECAGPCLVWFW